MMQNYGMYKIYQWEAIPYSSHNDKWNCDQIDLINRPIESVYFHRNQDLSISMIAYIKANALNPKATYQLGELHSNFESIKIHHTSGAQGTATITHIPKNTTKFDNNGNPINESIINTLELEIKYNNLPISYTIEWITNLKSEGVWHWPNVVNTKLQGKFNMDFSSKSHTISIEKDNFLEFNNSLSCLQFSFEDELIFIGETKTDEIEKKYHPGFILYQGNPSQEKMERIRLALSFLLGRFLPSLGYTAFDEKWDIVSYKCITPYDLDGSVYNSSTMPPIKLKTINFFINTNIVTRSVNAFYENFLKFDLKYISYLYWNAINSPAHIKASQFGATLEAIQRNYRQVHANDFQTALFKHEEWKIIQKALLDSLDKVLNSNSDNKEIDEKKIIKNKIYSLNQTPQSKLTNRFFDLIDISLSEIEENAFKQRNYSAHGIKTTQEDFSVIKNNYILMTLIHRILIKILNISQNYIDYYAIGHPSRNIKEPIGG
uniref:ApeA N-terminal domain-containing protein n=1 Tax=Chlorobium chlorochromatii (strain CaD3) TaxID=340177 RepID=Q3ARQ1_CHLCH